MRTCGPCRVPRGAARRTVPVRALREPEQWAALSAQGWTIRAAHELIESGQRPDGSRSRCRSAATTPDGYSDRRSSESSLMKELSQPAMVSLPVCSVNGPWRSSRRVLSPAWS